MSINIKNIKGISSGDKKGTLDGLTTKEVHSVESRRDPSPIDLTAKKIREIGIDSQVSQLQRSVVRLRVLLNGEDVGSGSGFLISSDGLILSVNHVPALGKSNGGKIDCLPGSVVQGNLKTWNELLGQKGKVELVADIPLLPKPEGPKTIFSSTGATASSIAGNFYKGENHSATAYTRSDNEIEALTVPIKIISELPGEDLILLAIDMGEVKDPYTFIKLTDVLPSTNSFTYSIGHPGGIKHNALALGEVLDPSFDVNKIKDSIKAHSLILNGIANAISGKGAINDGTIAQIARALSIQYAGIDVEPLINFMNGAVISTNRIAPGSSGGLLVNEQGEAVGITYLGFLLPLNGSSILRYSAGTLGFEAKHLSLSNLTGSVGMKKAIPFLEKSGVDIARIRDGEPAKISELAGRVNKTKAREAMKVFLMGQGIKDDELEKKLTELGLAEEPNCTVIKPTVCDSSSSIETSYFIKIADGSKVHIKAKPIEIVNLTSSVVGDVKSKRTNVLIDLEVKIEGGETVKLEGLQLDPSFSPETDLDADTRKTVISYFESNISKAIELNDLVEQAKSANSGLDTSTT